MKDAALVRLHFLDVKAGSSCSLTGGDIRIVGRFVDINAGRAAAFVWPSSTCAMKMLDPKTGELLAAVPHRVVGHLGINLKNRLRKVGESLNDGLEGVYRQGKPAEE